MIDSIERFEVEFKPTLKILTLVAAIKDKLAAKLERERIIAPILPKLSSEIIALIKEHAQLTIAEIATLTGANRNTLKVRLCELVEAQFIEKHGRASATFYLLKTE